MVLQRLMRQIVIVQMNVAIHTMPRLARTVVIVDIDLIVFQAAPETLNDDVILGTTLAVHADPNLVFLQQIDILWTGKMAALITVNNLGLTPRQRPSHRLQHEGDFQALIDLPIDDIAGIPIHDGVQVHPAVLHTDIRDVHRPHLIRLGNQQLPEQIRIDPVLKIALAQVRAGIDGHEAHFPHVTPYGVRVNLIPFPVHNGRNLPVAQERVLRVKLINPVLEANFLRGGRDRLVIQAGAIQAEQVGLDADRVLGAIPFQQVDAFLTRQVRGQIFF